MDDTDASTFVNTCDRRYNKYVENTCIQNDKTFLQTIILMVVLYVWIALLATILGIFYPVGIFGAWIALCIFFIYKKILQFPHPSHEYMLYIIIAILFTLSVASFTVPTLFAGRDQGSFSGAAIQLAQNKKLISHSPESTAFFDIYGRGKALNFPGFYYLPDGGLITQFSLPYIAFLGGFFGICGVTGLIVANSILLFLFILAITCVARSFFRHRYVLVFLAMLLTSFVIGWFAKFTLSENLAGTLLWSAIALYISLRDKQDRISYYTFFAVLALLPFVRIEGIWFFAILSYLTLRKKAIRTFLMQDLWWHIVFPVTTLLCVGFMILIMNQPFFITIAHAIFDIASDAPSLSAKIAHKYYYLLSIYTMYGLLIPLLLTGGTILLSLKHKKYRPILLIFVIMLPLFLYYFFPQISSDHPWMLRRFAFALVPATILIGIFGIAQIRTDHTIKKIFVFSALMIMLLANLPAFFLFFPYAENTTLLPQVHTLAKGFHTNDLILVDKNSTGNGWSMMTLPLQLLENRHAVYIFNPYDIQKIDRTPFDRILLIVPQDNINFYRDVLGDHMHPLTAYYFSLEQLDLASDKNIPQKYPTKTTSTLRDMIYEIK
ncbi:MAG: hypothetical protein WC819_00120 [Parcubacteria group bacterium]|jgi:hypothetical protein